MHIENIVREIIKEQSQIIGEQLARQIAINSGVVKFNSTNVDDLTITSPGEGAALEKIINSYEMLFGNTSVEVCIDVIHRFGSKEISDILPDSLNQRLSRSK